MKLKTAFVSMMFIATACAQAAEEGRDYTVLSKPIPQLQADKIEVLEFFGYFCVHCARLDPILLQHSRGFAKDVYLRTEHVVWQPEMLGLARVAAAVNASGLKYQANGAVFDAVYGRQINLADEAVFKKWAAAQTAFDSKKLLAAYHAPAAVAAAKKMQVLTETYRIASTPTVIVGGKYQVKFGADFQAGMSTVDALISKVRAERKMLQQGAWRKVAQ